MSLECKGETGTIFVICTSSGSERKRSEFKEQHYVGNVGSNIEQKRKLFKELFESYLNSKNFENDCYQLESVISVNFSRSTILGMPSNF